MNCKQCGAQLHPEANFCMKCGAKVEKEIRCYACGATVPEDAAFCFKCGINLKEMKEQAAGYDYYVTDMPAWVMAKAEEDWPEKEASITSLKVAEGMTACPNFWGMKKLRTVSLPSTLKEICGKAFCMTAVERLDIPDGVTEIGSHAFEACKSLRHVHLPNSLQRISYFAFFDCNEDELWVDYRSCHMPVGRAMEHLKEEGVTLTYD